MAPPENMEEITLHTRAQNTEALYCRRVASIIARERANEIKSLNVSMLREVKLLETLPCKNCGVAVRT